MRILIVYGSVFGQTRKIAEYLADHWRSQSFAVVLHDAARLPGGLDPSGFDAIVVASPIRMGAYRPSVVRFVQRYRAALMSVPSAFVSVSLAAVSARKHELARRELQKRLAMFCEKTGWTPTRVHQAAGGLPYTRYGLATRWIMRRIVESQEGDTDTTRDYEYTDWAALARFADSLVVSPEAVQLAAA